MKKTLLLVALAALGAWSTAPISFSPISQASPTEERLRRAWTALRGDSCTETPQLVLEAFTETQREQGATISVPQERRTDTLAPTAAPTGTPTASPFGNMSICPAGMHVGGVHQSQSGSGPSRYQCLFCPPATFSSTAGQLECEKCPQYSTSSLIGATNHFGCSCIRGSSLHPFYLPTSPSISL